MHGIKIFLVNGNLQIHTNSYPKSIFGPLQFHFAVWVSKNSFWTFTICINFDNDKNIFYNKKCDTHDTLWVNEAQIKLFKDVTIPVNLVTTLKQELFNSEHCVHFSSSAHCLKITQNVAFEFFDFGISHQFSTY